MRLLTIGVVLMLAVAGAGCGGGDEAGSDTDTTVTETTATDETTTDETTTDGTETETDAGAFAGDCGELIAASAQLSQALGSAGSSDEGLSEAADFYEQLADDAPDELRDDFRVLADAYVAYVAVFSDLDIQPGETPDAEVLGRIQEASEAVSTPEVQAAATRIGEWTAAGCPG